MKAAKKSNIMEVADVLKHHIHFWLLVDVVDVLVVIEAELYSSILSIAVST